MISGFWKIIRSTPFLCPLIAEADSGISRPGQTLHDDTLLVLRRAIPTLRGSHGEHIAVPRMPLAVPSVSTNPGIHPNPSSRVSALPDRQKGLVTKKVLLLDHHKKTSLYDDAIERKYITQEIFSKSCSERGSFSHIWNEGISPAKMDAAIKIKGFIFLEFTNSLRSRRDRSFNVRRHHPKSRFRKIAKSLITAFTL